MSSPENDNDLDIDSSLFFGSTTELDDFQRQAHLYFQTVEKNDSIRLLVLETWLFVDFTIRQFLLSGLGLRGFDELDLRYSFLPRGLRECVRLVTRLRDFNLGLPEQPEERFSAKMRKWHYLRQNHRAALEEFLAAEEDYGKAYSLEWAEPKQPLMAAIASRSIGYRTVPLGWLEVAARIDDTWMRRQDQLNEARNVAAHSHDETRIAMKFGFSGADTAVRVKKECLVVVETLLGITSESRWLR